MSVRISQNVADEVNHAANFIPEDVDGDSTKPCLALGGAQVYAYWEPDGLCVALHLDTGSITAGSPSAEGTVPVTVTINGDTVFTAA